MKRSLVMGLSCTLLMTAALAKSALADDTAPAPAAELRGTLAVPVAVEPTAESLDRTGGQQWHRVTLKLVGSMCPACLMSLEGKLRDMPGVKFVKVTRPATSEQPTENHGRNASVVLLYDANAGKFDRMIELIKKELYKPTDVKDVQM